MMLEIIGLAAALLLLFGYLAYIFFGGLSPVSKPTGMPPLPRPPKTVSEGLMKAAFVFLIIGLILGVAGFLFLPSLGALVASGPFGLAIVLWVIGLCMK